LLMVIKQGATPRKKDQGKNKKCKKW
jgi:hypothetical protein